MCPPFRSTTHCKQRLHSLFGAKIGFGWILDLLYTGQFGGVHAFGCNSAESKPISMKSEVLYEYIVQGWPWQILGAIRAVAPAWKAGEILFFF